MGDEKRGADGTPRAEGGKERRSSVRLPVEMWVEEITPGGLVFRRAGNLSKGGLYLDQTIPLPVGTTVKLKFTLPGDEDAITLLGEIVAISTADTLGMRIKFTEVEPADQAKVDGYLRRSLTPVMGV